jgi:hypothetical protein
LELDDAGERDIYKINLLEAMLMTKEAWDSITPQTITNCWNHTGIQRDPILIRVPAPSNPPLPCLDSQEKAAWDIIRDFASTDMTLPEAEKALNDLFGDKYTDDKWRPALAAVMAAENDVSVALDAIDKLHTSESEQVATTGRPAESATQPSPLAKTDQGARLEAELMESVIELKKRRRIFGALPTVDELLAPEEEEEVGASPYQFEGGDKEIVAQVLHEQAVARGEVVDIDSDDDDEENGGDMRIDEMLHLCEELEKGSISAPVGCSLEFTRALRRFRVELKQSQFHQAKQVTLTSFWGKQ